MASCRSPAYSWCIARCYFHRCPIDRVSKRWIPPIGRPLRRSSSRSIGSGRSLWITALAPLSSIPIGNAGLPARIVLPGGVGTCLFGPVHRPVRQIVFKIDRFRKILEDLKHGQALCRLPSSHQM